jgi:hypothetical protein
MAKNYNFLIKLLFIYVLFYISFFFLFFFILGSNSVELVIAFSFIFLISLIYFFFSGLLNDYFINVSKTIWIHFSNLILLFKLSKDVILNINKTYLYFLEYKMYVLYNVNYSLDYIFSELILNLSEKFFINNLLKIFYNKLILIQNSNNLFNEDFFDINEDDSINLIEVYILYSLLNDINNING